MPRRKMPAIKDPSRIAEILHRKGKDPYEEMLRVVEETIPMPHDVDPKIVIPMMDRYDIGEKDGKRCLKLKAMHRFEIWKEMAQYVYPKLRSSETKEEKDINITVSIKQFGNPNNSSVTSLISPPVMEARLIEDNNGD